MMRSIFRQEGGFDFNDNERVANKRIVDWDYLLTRRSYVIRKYTRGVCKKFTIVRAVDRRYCETI